MVDFFDKYFTRSRTTDTLTAAPNWIVTIGYIAKTEYCVTKEMLALSLYIAHGYDATTHSSICYFTGSNLDGAGVFAEVPLNCVDLNATL